MTAQRPHCTNHCSRCGLHFHSVEAFDAHREGDYASNDPELGRHCVHPLDKQGKDGRTPFITLTTVGVCAMYADNALSDVRIWSMGASVERARTMRRPRGSEPRRRFAGRDRTPISPNGRCS